MESWKELAQARKLRRDEGRRRGTETLRRAGIEFTTLDRGWHLRIETSGHAIDYTPSTGTWRTKALNGLQYGIKALIKHIKEAA